MVVSLRSSPRTWRRHSWTRHTGVAFVPDATMPITPLLADFVGELLRRFAHHGHQVDAAPNDSTDVILTTAPFGQSIDWRRSLLFTARRQYGLSHTPTVIALVHASTLQFRELMAHFRQALRTSPPDLRDYAFPGLAPQAHRVLIEQGQRGGPILALLRLLQGQTKCIRIVLLVGDTHPLAAYHFDLVGGHPRSDARDLDGFYDDIVHRIVTAVSTSDVADHQMSTGPIPAVLWRRLSLPRAMCRAGRELAQRHFFTEMVVIARLVRVPAVSDAVSSQYSEGCFASWDPTLGALIATVTGSARPVDKGSISENDLAVILGVRPDGRGAIIRPVEGLCGGPPSSEAVEMMAMDTPLPSIALAPAWGIAQPVPVVRSKLHGHRGISAYDPRYVEYVPLDPPYYHYPVTCGTDAQARGIEAAFARSEALQSPDDPRQVVFTVLPAHGAVIVEKWVPGSAPFQVIWQYMDAGHLRVSRRLPQGPMEFVPRRSDRRLYVQPA